MPTYKNSKKNINIHEKGQAIIGYATMIIDLLESRT
jgi:hypothetical protein